MDEYGADSMDNVLSIVGEETCGEIGTRDRRSSQGCGDSEGRDGPGPLKRLFGNFSCHDAPPSPAASRIQRWVVHLFGGIIGNNK